MLIVAVVKSLLFVCASLVVLRKQHQKRQQSHLKQPKRKSKPVQEQAAEPVSSWLEHADWHGHAMVLHGSETYYDIPVELEFFSDSHSQKPQQQRQQPNNNWIIEDLDTTITTQCQTVRVETTGCPVDDTGYTKVLQAAEKQHGKDNKDKKNIHRVCGYWVNSCRASSNDNTRSAEAKPRMWCNAFQMLVTKGKDDNDNEESRARKSEEHDDNEGYDAVLYVFGKDEEQDNSSQLQQQPSLSSSSSSLEESFVSCSNSIPKVSDFDEAFLLPEYEILSPIVSKADATSAFWFVQKKE